MARKSPEKTTYKFSVAELKEIFAETLGVDASQIRVNYTTKHVGFGEDAYNEFSGLKVQVEGEKDGTTQAT